MRRILNFLLPLLLVPLLFPGHCPAGGGGRGLATDGPFPDLELSAPGGFAKYLGLEDENVPFRLSQVEADVILLEISAYFCGPCRASVPELNEIMALTRTASGPRVRLLSIGAGDSPKLVAAFARELAVSYPLFPDPDLQLHALAGSVPAPHTFTILVRPGQDPPLEIKAQKTGRLPVSAREFLDQAQRFAQ